MNCETDGLLQIQDLSVRRGKFLLDSISLTVREDEILSIIGKTGAGKTMLLEAAAGFYEPDRGKVFYRGAPIRKIPVFRRNIGYLYQDYSLFPHMTVSSNIAYGLRMRGMPKAEIRDRVREMAARFEIRHILDQYPGTLSGGEQQRVALARALMTRPPLLLLDEPFSALDPVTKQSMHAMMQEIRAEFHCSVIFVTHNFTEAEQLADRIGVLISGRLCGIVKSCDLYTAGWEREVLDFLGVTAQNAIKVE